jgi:hypothetical protein
MISGDMPLAMHWHDGIWTAQHIPAEQQTWLKTLLVAGPTNVWAGGTQVHADPENLDYMPTLYHWDGNIWQQHPTLIDAYAGQITSSFAEPNGTLWLGGIRFDPVSRMSIAFILQRQADTWNELPLPLGNGHSHITGLAFNDTVGWAVGYSVEGFSSQTTPFLLRWDGTSWQQIVLEGEGVFSNVVALHTLTTEPSGAIWMMGGTRDYNYIWRWDNTEWQMISLPSNIVQIRERTSLIVLSADNIWLSHPTGAYPLLHWNGATWSQRPMGGDLLGAAVTSLAVLPESNDLLAVLFLDNLHMSVAQFQMPTVQFPLPATSSDVSAGSASIRVAIDPPVPVPVQVAYRTADGSALAERDYVATISTLTVPACAADAVLSVPLREVPTWAHTRTFAVQLEQSTGAKLGAARHISVAITNIAQAPTGQVMHLPVMRQTDQPPNPKEQTDRIAFIKEQNGVFDLYTVRTDGSDLRNLTNDLANDSSPTWSPDNSRILFTSNRSGRSQLYTIPATGGDATLLVETPFDTLYAAWSPDGATIAFVTAPPDGTGLPGSRIMLVGADGSNLRELVPSLPYANQFNDLPRWSPDSQQLAFRQG